jgi:Bacterial Ig domain
MRKTCLALGCAAVGLLAVMGGAQATCKGNFSLQFGYTTTENWTMVTGTTCHITYNFDYVALYGVGVRQQAKHGTVRATGMNTLEYTPKKGFKGTDTFIIEVEGGYVSWHTGTATMRSKAGAAVTMVVQ